MASGATQPSQTGKYRATALVLQGGGALGAYQFGAYEALVTSGYQPNWLAGISIGSVNAAIICGNRPEHRLERLRTFWERVSIPLPSAAFTDEALNKGVKYFQGAVCGMMGIPGMVRPRPPFELFYDVWCTPATPGLYDSEPLRRTLLELVDFDYLNRSDVRLSLGAVNIRSGNLEFFDSSRETITVNHILASTALPPYFPPAEVNGEYYWDGGLISNTPLHWILGGEGRPETDTLIFQVDLWSKKGPLPEDMLDVEERRKDIAFSSRTRINLDYYRDELNLRKEIVKLGKHLPQSERENPEVEKILRKAEKHPEVRIVHFIYGEQVYNTMFKDYAFSGASIRKHWRSGLNDTGKILKQRDWYRMPEEGSDIHIYYC